MSSQVTNIATLYIAEHDRLRRALVRRGVSAAAAADMVQETFLRMLRAPANDLGNPQGYLFRTAGNIAIDEHRRQTRTNAIIDTAAELDVSVADSAPQPEAAFISSEEIAALHQALAELPPRCREVLMLHKFEGLSYAEIADRLCISKNTVMVHLGKAINILRLRFREISSPTR